MRYAFFCFFILFFSVLFGQEKLSICEIQGPGLQSPHEGEIVTTQGVVTANFSESDQLRGFFIQDDACDIGRPSSKGLFVFTGSTPLQVAVGDSIEITGEVKEFFNLTELSDIVEFEVLNSEASFEYYTIELPVSRRSQLESFENMMVRFEQPLYVTDHFNLAEFGQLRLSANDILPIPTQLIDPNDADPTGVSFSGSSNVAAVRGQEEVNNNNSILLDDGSTVRNPSPLPYVNQANGTITAGSSIENLQGVLSYSFEEYRLHPTQNLQVNYKPRATRLQFSETAPPLIVLSGFNILNYFTTLGEWGAQTEEELERQTSKIVQALLHIDADVFGLMELENNGDEAYTVLLNALNNELGQEVYRALDADRPGNFQTKNVIFYKSTSVEPVGPLYATDENQFERASLGQVFRPLGDNGGEFLFVSNHLRFKGCGGATGLNQDQNDGQACYNQRRKEQAAALVGFIEDIQSQTGVGPVYILGDMNAYYQEDPIDLLRANGYQSLMEEDEFSFVFRGEYGALDHALANAEGQNKVYDSQILHINSLEPRFLEYAEDNLEFYQDNMYRSSDHDPVSIFLSVDKLLNNEQSLTLDDAPSLFPNPVQDQLFINVPNDLRITSMQLVDINGLVRMEVQGNNRFIDLKTLPAGSYILRIESRKAIWALPVVKN